MISKVNTTAYFFSFLHPYLSESFLPSLSGFSIQETVVIVFPYPMDFSHNAFFLVPTFLGYALTCTISGVYEDDNSL